MQKKIKRFIAQAIMYVIELIFSVCFLVVARALAVKLWIGALLLMALLILYTLLEFYVDKTEEDQ